MSAMCPQCARLFPPCGLIPDHDGCEGSMQNPRCPESDGRPLWSGESNPHFYRNQPGWQS